MGRRRRGVQLVCDQPGRSRIETHMRDRIATALVVCAVSVLGCVADPPPEMAPPAPRTEPTPCPWRVNPEAVPHIERGQAPDVDKVGSEAWEAWQTAGPED